MILDFAQLDTIPHDREAAYLRGTFDLLHPGHAELIQFAAQQADVLVVGIVSDEVVKSRKGPGRPIMSERDRLRMIDSLKRVDYCFIVPRGSPDKPSIELVFEKLKPSVFVQRDEGGDKAAHFAAIADKYSIRTATDTSDKLYSTTNIVESIKRT
jgi:D-beta-D-heptose 7-phosphate kinase/D-beta-D-heptose 1-phosphate adenosyltransferase